MLLERESAIHDFSEIAKDSVSSGKILLLCGEAGVGKTSLVEHMRTRLGNQHQILWSGCDPLLTPRPYAPLHDFAPILSEQLLALLDNAGQAEQIANKIATELYVALEALIQPCILVIEDMHWADNATLDVLKFLVRRMPFTRCLLCLTFRNEEIDLRHPLSQLLALTPSAHTKRIQLTPLSLQGIETLTNQTVHDAKDLFDITAGNPFFITEILASQHVQQQSVPSSVKEAIGLRVLNLAKSERELLETLCLVPYSIPETLLTKLMGETAETFAMACVARNLLVYDVKGEFKFRHELARLAIVANISADKQKKLHRDILTALEALGICHNLAWLVHHAQGAYDPDAVLKYAIAAATDAALLGAHKEAAAYYEKALHFVEYAPNEVAAQLYESWAYEVGLASHMDATVIDARRAAITLYKALGRQDKVGENLRWLSRLYWYQGDVHRAEHYANEAIKTFEQLPASSELAMAYSMRSQLDMLNERTEEAVQCGNKALALESRFPNPMVKVHALTNIGSALLMSGDRQGEDMLERSLKIAQETGNHEEVARVYTNYADYCMRYRRLPLAEKLISEGIQYDIAHDLDSWTYYLVGIQAQLRLEQGRLVDAETIAQGVQSLENQTLLMKLPALIVLARAQLRLGREAPQSILEQALNNAIATEEFQYIIPARMGLIEWAWLSGNPLVAQPHIEALNSLGDGVLNPWQLGELASWVKLLGMPSEHIALANLPEPYVLQFEAKPMTAKDSWQQLGMPYQGALSLLFTQGVARPKALLQAYSLFEQVGAQAPMQWLRSQACSEGIDESLPSVKRGPYAKSRAHPAGLTSKEQQVLKMMVTGASNQDIALGLSRSRRTIENHVSSILAKLNVENRIEALLRVQNEPWLSE